MSKQAKHLKRRIEKEWANQKMIRSHVNIYWPALNVRITFGKGIKVTPEEIV